jgi:hypothetical protein
MSLLLAYFDPSAGSLLLQAMVGGFGGLIVLGRYLWTHFLGSKANTTAITSSAGAAQPAAEQLAL